MHSKVEFCAKVKERPKTAMRQLINFSGKKNQPLKLLSHFSFIPESYKALSSVFRSGFQNIFAVTHGIKKNTLYIYNPGHIHSFLH